MGRRAWIGGLSALVVAGGACMKDDQSVVHFPDELRNALLVTDDLGPGWTEHQRDAFTERAPENPTIEAAVWCPDAAEEAARLDELAGQAGADVELSRGEEGSYAIREQAWSDGHVEEYFDSVVDAIDECDGASWSAADGGAQSIQRLDSPEVGDESVSALATSVLATPQGERSFQMRVIVARFGSTLMVLQDGELLAADGQPLSTQADWALTVSTAATKLGRLDD